jgi:hypothetical protein
LQITPKKVFIKLGPSGKVRYRRWPGVNAIELFFFVTDGKAN